MDGKRVAVVTGANKGIGFAIVRNLCRNFEGIVYLTARDEERGKAAVCALEKEGLKPRYHQLDISDQTSVDNLALYFRQMYGGLDVLVNNAAIMYPTDPAWGAFDLAALPEIAERTVQINFSDTLRVCDALFPLLRPHARVVHVSSLSSKFGFNECSDKLKKRIVACQKIDDVKTLMTEYVKSVKDGTHTEQGWATSPYKVSKIGVSAVTSIQQRKFDTGGIADVVVNSACPGFVDTDMSLHRGKRTVEQGAETPSYLALLPPNCQETRGKFFSDLKMVNWCEM